MWVPSLEAFKTGLCQGGVSALGNPLTFQAPQEPAVQGQRGPLTQDHRAALAQLDSLKPGLSSPSLCLTCKVGTVSSQTSQGCEGSPESTGNRVWNRECAQEMSFLVMPPAPVTGWLCLSLGPRQGVAHTGSGNGPLGLMSLVSPAQHSGEFCSGAQGRAGTWLLRLGGTGCPAWGAGAPASQPRYTTPVAQLQEPEHSGGGLRAPPLIGV